MTKLLDCRSLVLLAASVAGGLENTYIKALFNAGGILKEAENVKYTDNFPWSSSELYRPLIIGRCYSERI